MPNTKHYVIKQTKSIEIRISDHYDTLCVGLSMRWKDNDARPLMSVGIRNLDQMICFFQLNNLLFKACHITQSVGLPIPHPNVLWLMNSSDYMRRDGLIG
jgi:hypothetical protein